MYREIVNLLKCPKCSENLCLSIEIEENTEIIEGKLSCKNGHNWVIQHGIINFASEEQELTNNWTEAYEEFNDEEMDKKILEGVPQNQKFLVDKAKEYIIDRIYSENNKFILDIATGRGSLFKEMIKDLKNESQIICTDLSFTVLKHDRLRGKEINPDAKVNYVACDATQLPFKDNSIDFAVSFFGIQNMLNLAGKGIDQVKRVLKSERMFLDSYIIIKEDSDGFIKFKDFCTCNNIMGAEEFTIKTGIEKAYAIADLPIRNMKNIGESIGEKNELDLIPFEKEWFAMLVVESCKLV